MSTARYLIGDTRQVVASLPDASVDLVLTSPPFLALRSYLAADDPAKGLEIGQEANPAAFLDVLLELTAGWRRVLAPHGSIAIELGDTYSGSSAEGSDTRNADSARFRGPADGVLAVKNGSGWPLAKSLALVPELYRVALAYGVNPLTGAPSPAGRWRVRNVVRWHRPNPPVGALGDKYRPSTSDMVIACVSDRRWFDLDAVREPAQVQMGRAVKGNNVKGSDEHSQRFSERIDSNPAGAPPLDTWIIPTHPYPGSHFATWPPALCVKPIKSMCPERVCTTCGEPSRRIVGDTEEYAAFKQLNTWESGGLITSNLHRPNIDFSMKRVETLGWTDCGHGTWRAGVVLDPFGGSGTTGAVATGLGRDAVLVDLDSRNAELARDRIGMFLDVDDVATLNQPTTQGVLKQ